MEILKDDPVEEGLVCMGKSISNLYRYAKVSKAFLTGGSRCGIMPAYPQFAWLTGYRPYQSRRSGKGEKAGITASIMARLADREECRINKTKPNTITKKGSVAVAPALAQEKFYTIDDIYSLPEGKRAELIDGQIYYMAPPTRNHQEILSFLHAAIYNHITKNKGECKVYPAPFAVFLSADDSKYLEPDISVVCDKHKLNDHGCNGAPDWIIEIVSPGSRRMDYYTKLSLYRSADVREYWIVDPMKQTVLVYDMEHDAAPAIYSFTDSIKVNIYGDLWIDFRKLNL